MRNADLSPRLLSAANYVRLGAVFADVGTDHAYLPLFLLEKGIITHAVCSDINKGPLDTARKNAAEMGYSEHMDFVLTDGASALSEFGITDMAICGMGGELIADIIEKAPFLKSPNINLILQPMSKQSFLRKYLANAGFSLTSEKYTSEPRHNYVTMLACYSGHARQISDLEAEIGYPPYNFSSDKARLEYIKERLFALEKAARGKALGSECADYEENTAEKIRLVLTGFED